MNNKSLQSRLLTARQWELPCNMNLIHLKTFSLLVLHPYLISHVATCYPLWECTQVHTHPLTEQTHRHKDTYCSFASFLNTPFLPPPGEPSPPAVHGQRGMGKAYRLGLVKQDDGGMPIVEYIVKYKTVSNLEYCATAIRSVLRIHHNQLSVRPWPQSSSSQIEEIRKEE